MGIHLLAIASPRQWLCLFWCFPLCLTPTLEASEFGMCRNLLYLASFSSTYRGPLCACLQLGEGHAAKAENRQVPAAAGCIFLWLWAFSAGRDNAECGSLVSVSREGLSQLVVLHWKVIKKRKKHPAFVASKQLHAKLAWLSNIWGLGSYFLLNGIPHEKYARSLKTKLDSSKS